MYMTDHCLWAAVWLCAIGYCFIYELLSMVLKTWAIPGHHPSDLLHAIRGILQLGVYAMCSLKRSIDSVFCTECPVAYIAANEWVSKNCAMTRGAEERRGWGEDEEEGRETLQSALPPSVWEAAAAAALRLWSGSRRQLHTFSLAPISTGREGTCIYLRWLLTPWLIAFTGGGCRRCAGAR